MKKIKIVINILLIIFNTAGCSGGNKMKLKKNYTDAAELKQDIVNAVSEQYGMQFEIGKGLDGSDATIGVRGKDYGFYGNLRPTSYPESYKKYNIYTDYTVADDVYFAYKVKDNSMIGAYKSISSDSVLLVKKISRENLKEDDLYSQLSGKLVVANVCGRESVVRQVLFDGVNVSLQAWNANVPSLNAVIEGHSSSSYTTTNNICLFGVVTKAIQIFE